MTPENMFLSRETNRLLLREVVGTDAAAILALHGNAEHPLRDRKQGADPDCDGRPGPDGRVTVCASIDSKFI
jgi:hypothetical protein